MNLYSLFLVQLAVTVGSLAYIKYITHRVNYRVIENKLKMWGGTFLVLGLLPWIAHLLGSPPTLVIAGSVLVCLTGLAVSTWDREYRIDETEVDNPVIKKYRFILPLGAYSDKPLLEWAKFAFDPRTYVVEIHLKKNENRKVHKYCFDVDNGTPSDSIKTDPRVLHGCRLCENAEKDFVQMKSCWNNPYEHKVKDADLCQSCYIKLTDKVEDEISGFESPKGEFLAANL